MNVLYIFADTIAEWNCSQWRCLSPSNALNASQRHKARLLWIQDFADYANPGVQDVVGQSDVIVFQRNFIAPELWEAMEYWRGLGKAVIADLDDDYPNLPHSNPAHRFWIGNVAGVPKPPIEMLTNGLRHCDILFSPSKQILQDWEDVLPGIWVPNWADRTFYKDIKPQGLQGERVVIGWGGSVSHLDSWQFSGLREAAAEICKQRPQVLFKICGNDPRIFEQLPVPAENKVLQPGVPPEKWPGVVATFGIGVAPLDLRDGAASYDARRSWIKTLEYLLCGVPWVGSAGAPYEDMAWCGTLVPNTVDAWVASLILKIDHLAEERKQMLRWNRQNANRYFLDSNIKKLDEAFQRALELRQLRERLPRVFYVTAKGQPRELAPINNAGVKFRYTQDQTFAATRELLAEVACDYAGVPITESLQYNAIQFVNAAVEGGAA